MTGPSRPTIELIAVRSRGLCEVCGGSLDQGFSRHHRRPRGMGGSKRLDTNSACNLLLVCGSALTGCHQVIESNRMLSRAQGRLLRQDEDPASVPVLLADGGWYLLLPNGQKVLAP